MFELLQLFVFLALGSIEVPEASCEDSSGHQVQMVEVEPGVSLELLEWSKEGQPILFLAGMGNTGHVYDEFALQFKSHYRVLALTRRGFGKSSQPAEGYSTDRLAKDIQAVMDALRIPKVILAGHSIAGEEMTCFAVQFPGRTAALIYLDSAYDHTKAIQIMQEVPPPSAPEPGPEDSLSVRAFAAYWARTNIRLPLPEICASSKFEAGGAYLGSNTPGNVFGALIGGLQAPEFDRVRVPALAVYSVARPADQDFPYYYELEPAQRAAADRFVARAQSWAEEQRTLFRTQMPKAVVRNLLAADHYLFISHEGHVAYEIERFLAGLQKSSVQTSVE